MGWVVGCRSGVGRGGFFWFGVVMSLGAVLGAVGGCALLGGP